MKFSDNEIREIEQLPDGSSVYEIGAIPEEEPKAKHEDSFYENLAIDFPEDGRKRLSSFLLDAIKEDIESRREWLDAVARIKKYMGYFLEDSNDIPFKQATRTFDTTLSTAVTRFYATTRSELLPPNGPAGYKINGISNERLEALGEKNRDWLNYYLTVVDESYYSDFERFIWYLGVYGTGFKKVYYDKLQDKVLARFIVPEDFIVNTDCTSILESTRLTHVLHLTKREILLNQQNEIYRDVDLPYLKFSSNDGNNDEDDSTDDNNNDGINLDEYTNPSTFDVYECHVYLNLDEFRESSPNNDQITKTVPLPYIITIDKTSKEILSIRNNWREDDASKKRKNYFVQYNYLPGFGINGIGLAQLAGSNAITLTRLLRQLVDAGTLKNLPAGLRVKGFGQQNNDIIAGAGEFIAVDTGGMPLKDCFMPFPFSEPSNTLRELRIEIMNQTKELCSTSEMGMLDSKEDISTATALLAFENHNRIQSVVQKSIHYSLTRELQLINELFKETINAQSFSVNGQQHEISSEDFVDEVKIIPVSDPSINSTPQRIMRAQATMQTALQAPQDHNMREIFKMVYKAQGLDDEDIESILKPDVQEQEVPPRDPISQVSDILLGKPVEAAMWQDHPAYILIFGVASQRPEFQSNPEAMAAIQALITKHQAMQYLVEMQQLLGIELPPLEEINDPQIQNSIALGLAQKLEESGATSFAEQQPPIDPQAVLLADIQQKAAEVEAKERIENQKAETDIFKAQLDFEKEKMKIESNEDIAILKAETELTKQGISNVD